MHMLYWSHNNSAVLKHWSYDSYCALHIWPTMQIIQVIKLPIQEGESLKTKQKDWYGEKCLCNNNSNNGIHNKSENNTNVL